MKRVIIFVVLLALACMAWRCTPSPRGVSITSEPFGTLSNGAMVQLYTLTNANGMQAKITNYGGIITHLFVPDQDGVLGDVVLGYDNLDGYLASSPYFGAIIGRYGNRIANAQFELDGVTYSLAQNNGNHHLHGGLKGFDKVVWEARPSTQDDAAVLELTYTSPDMEEGYPGELAVTVTYSVTNKNELKIDYIATTNKPTICNLTNHTYFNLKDGGASPHLEHLLFIDADYYLPVDETLIPLGESAPVDGTPLDFRQSTAIGARINAEDEQVRNGLGYDHTFVLNGQAGELSLACTVTEESTGRVVQVYTKEPGVQFYSGNFLNGSITGKNGNVYHQRHGFCLETQHFPDSPNQPNFPSVLLYPGETYETTTIYQFSTL
ncbi:galactose mutarotase [candidate division KSB1 bacterium]|nr:galactose mutarotase [candidate division KSB1 bacterium]RQW04410.1 MAG: galactose mutarotase [candidate division KSB1 bacterium]